MFKSIILLLSVGSAVSAAGNVCKTGNIINRPVNSQAYYWPSEWNENQPAPALARGQTCSWTVTVPKGYYAKLIINGQTQDSTSIFQTIDANGNLVRTRHEGMQPYYYPPNKFSISVSTQAVATFAFRIEWKLLPLNPTRYWGVGGIATLQNATDLAYYYGYDAQTGISLLPFPEDPHDYYSLRSTLIYEGGNLDGNYISNLFNIYQSQKQYLSSPGMDSVMVVNLEASNHTDLLLIQEAGYVKDLNYVELVPVKNSKYSATINSDLKRTALVSATYINQTLVDLQMDDNANLTVAYGTPDPFVFDWTYTGAQYKKLLPINYNHQNVLTFVLGSGTAVFTFQG